jgi:DNA invertase Pin-like site-specific DNA recombinase
MGTLVGEIYAMVRAVPRPDSRMPTGLSGRLPLNSGRASIAAVAQFEKDLLIERTLAGQARARAEGKKFGRPAVLTDAGRAKALQRLDDGASISAVAREMKASRATIMRVGRAGGRLSA